MGDTPGDPRQAPDPLHRHCVICEHTDFVHSDREPRHCLFSECECPGFAARPAAGEGDQRRRRSVA